MIDFKHPYNYTIPPLPPKDCHQLAWGKTKERDRFQAPGKLFHQPRQLNRILSSIWKKHLKCKGPNPEQNNLPLD